MGADHGAGRAAAAERGSDAARARHAGPTAPRQLRRPRLQRHRSLRPAVTPLASPEDDRILHINYSKFCPREVQTVPCQG